MRWYKIIAGSQTWDATNDPYALNVELNLPVTSESLAKPGAFARVWGISLPTLLNAKSLNKQPIEIYGGMQQGLPLANPAQEGLLIKGSILPAVGNWVGKDMTLDLYITAPLGGDTPARAANIVHNWNAGQPLSQAIQSTLSSAFRGFNIKINISPNLVLPYTDRGFYQNIGQYAAYILQLSRSIINSSKYLGVHISVKNKDIIVDDGTTQSGAKKISYTDLIGQPIWTGPNSIQFKTVMRGDIAINDIIELPKTLASLTAASASAFSATSNLIQGSFKIQTIFHTGNFRQADWQSWATTFDAVQQQSGSGSPLVPGQ